MRKVLSVLCTGLFVFIWMGVDAQRVMSLQEALDYAMQHNDSIRLAQLEVEDARGRVLEFKSTGLPTLEGSAGYQYYFDIPTQIIPDFISPTVDSRLVDFGLIDPSQLPDDYGGGIPAQFGTPHNVNAGLDFNALLFDGAFFVGLKAQRTYKELVQKQVIQTRTQVRFNVTKAYLNALITDENLRIVRKNLSNLDSTLRDTRAMYENGFAEKLDVDRLELSRSQLKARVENLERLVQMSRNLLKFQMGMPQEEHIRLGDSLDRLLGQSQLREVVIGGEYDWTQRPEYDLLEVSERLSKLDIKRHKVSYFPRFTAFASHSQSLQREDLFDENDNDWFPSTTAGVSLKVPIFDGLMRKARIDRAKVRLSKVQTRKDIFRQSVAVDVQNARIAFKRAKDQLENTEQSLRLAEKIYDTTKKKFQQGVGSSLEVTQAESDLYNAQRDYINALFEVMIARTDLERALGEL